MGVNLYRNLYGRRKTVTVIYMRYGIITLMILLVIIAVLAGGGYLYFMSQKVELSPISPNPPPSPTPPPPPTPQIFCAQDEKLCLDGTYVGRVPPLCEFASCPQPIPPSPNKNLECKSYTDCPSQSYLCEGTEGIGTIYPNEENEPNYTITKGVCKIKTGNSCYTTTQCATGLICHENICTEPIGRACAGSNDYSCPRGYQCTQSCGPPVAREGDPPPPYFCELNETARKPKNCPICLASNTNIATPMDEINVKNITVGMRVWSQNKNGERIESTVIAVSHTAVPKIHRVIHLVLSDGREVWVSPEHPTITGMPVRELRAGDFYDGVSVRLSETIPYWDHETYDLLPNSDTGYYWANGILLDSSLTNIQ